MYGRHTQNTGILKNAASMSQRSMSQASKKEQSDVADNESK